VNSVRSIPGLEHVQLHDSFVLDIRMTRGKVQLSLELALGQYHPRYHEPRPGEAWCYATARLVFSGMVRMSWRDSGQPLLRDPDGAVDHGGIDAIEVLGDSIRIMGDFGAIEVWSDPPVVELDEPLPSDAKTEG
jgi:hypothetical protein